MLFDFIKVIVLLLVSISSGECSDGDGRNADLLGVSLIYRHGDRSPTVAYPNDPYKDSKYWPMGFGQLTNDGKMQLYQLGQYLRELYHDFLNVYYVASEIRVLSTSTDRTLMSAECALAGLYPPKGDQVWNPDLLWQPVPVYSIDQQNDNLLEMTKYCSRYIQLFEEFSNSPEMCVINDQLRGLYDYVSKMSGQDYCTLTDIHYFYDTLKQEEAHNLTLPKWTKVVYPEPLRSIMKDTFGIYTATPELARLRVGTLLDEIASFFEDAAGVNDTSMKMHMYIAHEFTIVDVLNSLGLYNYMEPPVAATLFFELRGNDDDHYVNILYKNDTEPMYLVLQDCGVDCPLEKFLEILQPLRLTREEWDEECET